MVFISSEIFTEKHQFYYTKNVRNCLEIIWYLQHSFFDGPKSTVCRQQDKNRNKQTAVAHIFLLFLVRTCISLSLSVHLFGFVDQQRHNKKTKQRPWRICGFFWDEKNYRVIKSNEMPNNNWQIQWNTIWRNYFFFALASLQMSLEILVNNYKTNIDQMPFFPFRLM